MNHSSVATASKPRILLADDSRVVRASALKLLGDEFDVVVAEDGHQAWEMINTDSGIQAVFSDLGMPGLDGYELLRKIRGNKDPGISAMPVVIVTGQEGDAARERALNLGATDFVTKPFNRLDLLARARTCAKFQGTTRALRHKAQELEQTSTVDKITKLGNRQAYIDKLHKDRAFSNRHGQSLSLLRIAIDDFKGLSVKHGEEISATLLKQVADIISATIRNEDTAAHIAPGQFGVVLPACGIEGVHGFATRLLERVAASPLKVKSVPLAVTISVGATTPSLQREMSIEDMSAEVEQALLHAVKQGGNCLHQIPEYSPATSGQDVAPEQDPPMDLEKALAMIASGEAYQVVPHISALFKRLTPLFAAANKQQKLGLIELLRHLFVSRGQR